MKNQYESALWLFFFLVLMLPVQAQSKKELLAKINTLEQKQQQWAKDSLALRQAISDLEGQLQSQVAIANASQQGLQREREILTQKLAESQQIAKKNIEVFDLYSFGYQPLKNSDKEFESQKRALEDAINKLRWKNTCELQELLLANKRSEEEKIQLYTAFGKLYPELASLAIADFKSFSATTQANIRNAISKKTQNELKTALQENLWIQALDGRWGEANLLLLKKY